MTVCSDYILFLALPKLLIVVKWVLVEAEDNNTTFMHLFVPIFAADNFLLWYVMISHFPCSVRNVTRGILILLDVQGSTGVREDCFGVDGEHVTCCYSA